MQELNTVSYVNSNRKKASHEKLSRNFVFIVYATGWVVYFGYIVDRERQMTKVIKALLLTLPTIITTVGLLYILYWLWVLDIMLWFWITAFIFFLYQFSICYLVLEQVYETYKRN